MKFNYANSTVTGILSVVPSNEVAFENEIGNYNFPEKNSLKLKKLLGFDKRRVVEGNTTCSDLAVFGIQYLLDKQLLAKEEIGCIIFVSVTPDHISPPTSNIIQGRLDLSDDIVCLDINQGCAGFVIGLFNAFNIINAGMQQKVLLVNADNSSHIVSAKDRNTAPIFGDAASITIIEPAPAANPIHIDIKNRGSQYEAIIVPAGGVRMKASAETLELKEAEDGNIRNLHHSHMQGDLVYNFTTNDVVELITEVVQNNPLFSKEEIDYYILHQPNKFILKRMSEKLGVSDGQLFDNIVELFGNSNGSSIPLCITYNLSEQLKQESLKLCISGFGVGLSWNVLLMQMGQLRFCDIIEYP